jgi:hypothetical protein
MTPLQRRQEILQEMYTLTRMERGRLCAQARGHGPPPFYKLQCWHQGKNHTRYVPAAEVAAVQAALAGHARFQDLAEEFVEVTVNQTRRERAAGAKKNFRKPKPSATGKPKPS